MRRALVLLVAAMGPVLFADNGVNRELPRVAPFDEQIRGRSERIEAMLAERERWQEVAVALGEVTSPPASSPLTFTSFAGAVEPNLGSVDGVGSAARFGYAYDVEIDASGNLLVADPGRSTIRRISPGGEVTTYAGLDGVYGVADGSGAGARFSSPYDSAFDSSGNLYVADCGYLRKITPGGSVSTVASLGFCARGIAVDSAGVIYLSNYGGHSIYRMNPGAVLPELLAGGTPGSADGEGTAAQFNRPWDVAVDASGTVFVADYRNHTIRRISSTGLVETFAGTPGVSGGQDGPATSATFFYPRGLAFDASGNLFVTDGYGIRRIDSLGNVTTPYPNAWGYGLDVASDGTVYTAASAEITKVSPEGVVSVFAGQSTSAYGFSEGYRSEARFTYPSGAVVDASGNTFVADPNNRRIRRIDSAGNVTTFAGSGSYGLVDGEGTSAAFISPKAIARDPEGKLFVVDGNAIRIIDTSANVSTIAGTGAAGFQDGVGDDARFNEPYGITVNSAGEVFVTDFYNHSIRRLTPPVEAAKAFPDAIRAVGEAGTWDTVATGVGTFASPPASSPYTVTTVAGSGAAGFADGLGSDARFNLPWGIAADETGALLVADQGNRRIRRLTEYAGASSSFAEIVRGSDRGKEWSRVATGVGTMSTPVASSPMLVETIAGSGSYGLTDGTGTSASFTYPAGLAYAGNGEYYLTDNNAVRRLQVDPSVSKSSSFENMIRASGGGWQSVGLGVGTFATPPASATLTVTTPAGSFAYGGRDGRGDRAQFSTPFGIAHNPVDGSVIVADTYNSSIRKSVPAIDGQLTLVDPGYFSEATTYGVVGFARQLVFSGAAATYEWQLLRRPTGSTQQLAALSSTTVQSPSFTPDAPGYYVFRLKARTGDAFFEGELGMQVIAPPTLSINSVSVLEGDELSTEGTMTITVTPSVPVPIRVSVTLQDGSAVAPGDYTPFLGGSAEFSVPGHSSTYSFGMLLANGDTLDEDDETYNVVLSSPHNAVLGEGGAVGIVTILDDDPASAISISDATVTEGDSGTTPANFTVSLAPATGRTVTVDWTSNDGTAMAPSDYEAAGSTVVFAPGETSKTITVQVKGDVVDEDNETFTVDLSNAPKASITDAQAIGTITDDDDPPTVSVADASVVEGNSGTTAVEPLVRLSAASSRTVSVGWQTMTDGTATAGSDFVATSGTIEYAPGETTKSASVDVIGDQTYEPDETFSVHLSGATNATITDHHGSVTITNDDTKRVRGDFGGDGKSDITWRNQQTYETHAWMMNGTSIAAGGVMVSAGAEWKRMGVGDLDGNGKADLIWRHSSGEAHVWFMDGTALVAGAVLPYISADWLLGGIGDFNGDGKDDLIWTHATSGETHMWLMNGGAIGAGAVMPVNTTQWAIAVTGDFNGDGKDDLILRNKATGETHMWFMNGTSIGGGVVLPNVGTGWTIATSGDFNGDGKADLIWRYTATGETHMWFMNGGSIAGGAVMPGLTTLWNLAHTGDYDGDGKADLVWRQVNTGEAHMWLMNGSSIKAGAVLPGISSAWTTIMEGQG